MRIDSRLSKLEQQAKVTLRCDWCRYILHDTSPSAQKKYKAEPASVLNLCCRFCGTVFVATVSGDEYNREAALLFQNAEWGAQYRNERVFAATYWLVYQRTLKKWRAGYWAIEKVEARNRVKEQQCQQQRYEKKKQSRYAREREELKEKAFSFLDKMREKEEKGFAPHTFPLAAEIEAIEKPDTLGFIPGTYQRMEHKEVIARKVLYAVQVVRVCERVLWSKVLPETQTAIEELSSIIHSYEDDRARKAREEEEETARQEAEREQQRLEREAAVRPPVVERPAYQSNWNEVVRMPEPSYFIDNNTLARTSSPQRDGQHKELHPYFEQDHKIR